MFYALDIHNCYYFNNNCILIFSLERPHRSEEAVLVQKGIKLLA